MRFLALLIVAATTALAFPASPATDLSMFQQLNYETIESDTCEIKSGNNCAGAVMKDVIVTYGKANQDQQSLVLNAAKSSGATIVHELKDFGFSGLVPEPVIGLIKAHGASFDLAVHDNACAEIPWCGEAPC